jgi:hypothetical protein
MHMHGNYFFESGGFGTSDFGVMIYEIMQGLELCMAYASVCMSGRLQRSDASMKAEGRF